MLIQGGKISSGRLYASDVDGAYWISSIRSLRKITLPGVLAMLTPSSKPRASTWRMRTLPLPASMSSASILSPRTKFSPLSASVARKSSGFVPTKFDGEKRGRHLLEIELRLGAGMRLHVVRVMDEVLRPVRGQHIGLLEKVEKRIVAPLRVGEPLVLAVGFGDRPGRSALEPLQRRRPQIDELGGVGRLGLDRALGIGHVILGDMAERADHLADLLGDRGLDLPALARTHVGRERLAGMFDGAGDVAGQRLDVRHRILHPEAERIRRALEARRRRGGRRRLGRRRGDRAARDGELGGLDRGFWRLDRGFDEVRLRFDGFGLWTGRRDARRGRRRCGRRRRQRRAVRPGERRSRVQTSFASRRGRASSSEQRPAATWSPAPGSRGRGWSRSNPCGRPACAPIRRASRRPAWGPSSCAPWRLRLGSEGR